MVRGVRTTTKKITVKSKQSAAEVDPILSSSDLNVVGARIVV